MLQQSHKMELTRFRKEGLTTTVCIESGTDDDCPACRKLAGKVMTIEEALAAMPLPPQECACGAEDDFPPFSHCWYSQRITSEELKSSKKERQIKGGGPAKAGCVVLLAVTLVLAACVLVST